MMTDYLTGSARSPTPPLTDLRGTLSMEKKMAEGSSSSLMAGSIPVFALLGLVAGAGSQSFPLKGMIPTLNERIQMKVFA